jgi:hypothetical protein
MDLRIQSTEATPSNVCLFDTLDPNTGGTVFDPAELEGDADTVFVSESDAGTWVYNGSSYITKTYDIPDNTPFWLYGTSLDAGGNKTSFIRRDGPIIINSANSNGSRYAGYFYSRTTSGQGNGMIISRDERQTSGYGLRVRLVDFTTLGFPGVDQLRVNHDGSLLINDAYTLPNTGGTAGQVLTEDGAGNISFSGQREVVQLSGSDLTTALSVGTTVAYLRMGFAMTVTEVRASLLTAGSTSGTTTIDINLNGTSILSTKLTIDAGEKTSTTAATPAVISTSSLTDDAEITIDIDAISGGATEAGLIVTLIGNRA